MVEVPSTQAPFFLFVSRHRFCCEWKQCRMAESIDTELIVLDDNEQPASSLNLVVDPALLATKRVVFVGGLSDEVTVAMVRAAMIPFGDIQSVDMVRGCGTNK
jgi:hypothetical protein